MNRVAHRASPAVSEPKFDSDDSEEEDWESLNERERRKRKRMNGSQHVDLDRQMVHPVLRETLPKTKDGNDDDETKKPDTKDGGESKTTDTNGEDGAKKVEKMELVGRDLRKLKIIHAKDIASLALKCVPVLGATEDEVSVDVQYPGSRHRER